MKDLEMMKQQYAMQGSVQKELQERQIEGQHRLVAPTLREQLAETQAAVIAQTNPALGLKTILRGFEGYILNENGDWEKVGQEIINEIGRAKIASMLIPFMNDPIRFGNISGREVRNLTLQITNDITEAIGEYWRDYGVDSSSRAIIVDALLTMIFITLTRSEGQGEKNFLSKVVVESVGNRTGRKEESNWKKYFKI